MSDITRREFIRRSLILSAGASLIISCEDNENIPSNPISSSPGMLSSNGNAKKIIVIGAGMSGLVAAYELVRVGHDVTILEARDRIGGRVLTIRSPFSNNHFAEGGAARIKPSHNLTLGYANHFNLNLDPFYATSGDYVNMSNGNREIISNNTYLNTSYGSILRNEYLKIRGGSDLLPHSFYNSSALNNKIYLGVPVTSIHQQNNNVTVQTSNGNQFIADRVLCTVPITVLNKIQFTPPLSPEKQTAMNGGYRYAPSTRVYMQFQNRFWENESLNGWGNSDIPEEIWQPTWDLAGSTGIIMSYLRWTAAQEMDALSEEERINYILSRWENIFPGAASSLQSGMSQSWAEEEWSKGAWASPTGSQDAALANHIGLAEDRIHFAGEHASDDHGWMQGALFSGLRAAAEINEGN
ncbi:MAG: FAD-dependent oxidoreductase [Candidatus Marinimicrobia bacterium]|jgi:monoamine oxidase|nr:FAD-dependent oxidoreductase [Candidatus Neomarinimicrobiota bacterium]